MSAPLVYTRGKRIALGAAATGAHWLGDRALITLGDGGVRVSGLDGEDSTIIAHDGAVLSSAIHPDNERIITGGDDGKLIAISPTGAVEAIADFRGKWVDHVAASAVSKVIVAGVGKQAIVFRNGGESHRFIAPTSIGGLALDAKGRRLAMSHYGGVTQCLVLAADSKGLTLGWAGSHLTVTMSPEADYVVSAMQENELHGWRMPDRLDLRMSGYSSKTRSFSWDRRGRWLATSGADCAVVWPFAGKLGPQGKEPLQVGRREALVTAVAFHPEDDMLAIGYADGMVRMVRLVDMADLDLDEPGEGPVTALTWSADGARIAFADDAGRGGIVKIA